METQFLPFQADPWIVANRVTWDATHPMHTVLFEDCSENIIATLENDNSMMGCFGPMLTPKAALFLSSLSSLQGMGEDYEIFTIDGMASEECTS